MSKDQHIQPAGLSSLNIAKVIHGAIDFKKEGINIGFGIQIEDEGGPILQNLYIIGENDSFRSQLGGEKISLQETPYLLDGRAAPPLFTDCWDTDKSERFLAAPSCPLNTYDFIKSIIKKYLQLPRDGHYGLLAVWTMATYFSQLFPAFPFLLFFGPKESGKSKALEILSLIAFNPVKVKKITEAALCDTADGQRGTILVDQAESIPNSIVGIMADSYKKFGAKRRLIGWKNGQRTVKEFSGYCAKAYASTKLLDPDLRDRCSLINMQRANQTLPDIIGTEQVWVEIRDLCYRSLLTGYSSVNDTFAMLPSKGTRQGELWRPLEAVVRILRVPDKEIASIKAVFDDGTDQTKSTLTLDQEAVFQVLLDRAREKDSDFELTPGDIRNEAKPLLSESNCPDNRRVGTIISQFSLAKESKKRTRRKTVHYTFSPDHVEDVVLRYMDEPEEEGPPA